MLELKDFVKVENGELVIDKDAYEKALSSEFDRERTKASSTARANAEKELKDRLKIELAEEAKLSAEEKARKEVEKEMQALKAERVALNKEKVKTVLESAGFTNDEILIHLEAISDDTTKTMETTTKLAEARKKAFETKKAEWDKEIALKQPNPNGKAGDGSDETQATQFAKSFRLQQNEVKL